MFFREMLEPSAVFDSWWNENLKPYHESLESLVRGIMGRNPTNISVRFSAFATAAISSYFHNVERYIKKLYPDESFGTDSIDDLADLIAKFVVGGIKALRLPAK